jgi:hypothetical protein
MTYWIIPFNPNYFRLADCLREQGYVEWTQRYKYAIGDIVYIYSAKPDSRILYKMEVTAINLSSEECSDDTQYLTTPFKAEPNKNIPLGFRMIPLAENTTEKLTLEDLLEHGLKWVPQGGLKVREPLLNYMLSIL